jgi:hypothetical protein
MRRNIKMKDRILLNLKYEIYWYKDSSTALILSPVKVKHLEEIKYQLLYNGYYYKNLIIGRPGYDRNTRKFTEMVI